jgi:hypothetical protein
LEVLILKYRVEPHPGINNEIYQALVEQVGKVGIQMQLKIGSPENPDETMVIVHGQFISVEGEHYQERLNVDSGPSNREPDHDAMMGGPGT